MADITIEVEGLEELGQALKKYPEQWQQIANEALKPGLVVLEYDAKADAPHDKGELHGNIGSKVEGSGSTIIGKMGANLEYAPWALEYGRKPGKMPPVDVIEEWAQRHGMAGAGYVIARAIGARGIKAPRVLTKTLEKNKDRVVKLFEQGITNALKRLFP